MFENTVRRIGASLAPRLKLVCGHSGQCGDGALRRFNRIQRKGRQNVILGHAPGRPGITLRWEGSVVQVPAAFFKDFMGGVKNAAIMERDHDPGRSVRDDSFYGLHSRMHRLLSSFRNSFKNPRRRQTDSSVSEGPRTTSFEGAGNHMPLSFTGRLHHLPGAAFHLSVVRRIAQRTLSPRGTPGGNTA